jgi:predicted aldo/keto reductase-like oxidoreductase
MNEERKRFDRRDFLKTIGAAGLSAAWVGCKGKEQPPAADPNDSNSTGADPKDANCTAADNPQAQILTKLPTRVLGKTRVKVPILALGTMYNLVDNQIMLIKSLELGVNYWDTANSYGGGNSELGIGKYFERNPEKRKEIFLATKASVHNEPLTGEKMEERLQLSLERMKTDHIDLYYGAHALEDPAALTDELKTWVKSAKDRGLISWFGFSTHKNMIDCLNTAARLDWIDIVMTSYNFRLVQDPKMLEAVDACHKAGVGLVAMKTTGKTTLRWARQRMETDEDKKMVEHFVQKGWTPEQACVKLAMDNERISCVCVGMSDIAVLNSNLDAVLDKTPVTQEDKDVLARYAAATCDGYCAGCAHKCGDALPEAPYISEIMRYLMYHNSYGDKTMARQLFAQIPASVRNRLLDIDYTAAERACPQRMAIGKLMEEAVAKLA